MLTALPILTAREQCSLFHSQVHPFGMIAGGVTKYLNMLSQKAAYLDLFLTEHHEGIIENLLFMWKNRLLELQELVPVLVLKLYAVYFACDFKSC